MSNHQEGDTMKKAHAIGFIIIGVIVLGVSCYFMGSMVEILKRGNRIQDVSSSTNVVCRSAAVVLNISGVDNKVDEGSLSMIAAYDSLSNELSSWMAIMGIFATVFGLVLPLGSYLLQQRSLNREKEDLKDEIRDMKEFVNGERKIMMDDVKDKIKDMKEEMEKIGVRNHDEHLRLINTTKEEISLGMIHRLQPMWNFLALNFDRFLVDEANKIKRNSRTVVAMGNITPSADNVTPTEIANFFIGFDIYLDCLVRADNAGVIIEAIYKYRPTIDAVRSNSSLWQEVCCILKNKIHKSPDFVSGSEFERLIGADTQKYEWLKSLYDEIIPWKFS